MTIGLAAAAVVGGLGLSVLGADLVVRGVCGLAARLRVPPLIVGLTVVAFGTSTPELAVSIHAARTGEAAVAFGNVLGSNIFNALAILGVCAAVLPLAVNRQIAQVDGPVMLAAALLMWLASADGLVSRGEGVALFIGGPLYVGWCLWNARRGGGAELGGGESIGEEAFGGDKPTGVWRNAFFGVSGLVALVIGSRLLVDGGVDLARLAGVSDLAVGLTVVAWGTSMPELLTSVVATARGQRDIAVGNVIGSNILNVFCVLGPAAAVSSQGMPVAPQALAFDLPVLAAISAMCLPILLSGRRIARGEAAILLMVFTAYTASLLNLARGADIAPYQTVVYWGLLPITAGSCILAPAVRFLRERRRPALSRSRSADTELAEAMQ